MYYVATGAGKKMQSGQLTDMTKGLWSKNLESIAPVEPKIQNAIKSEIFMSQHIDRQELITKLENCTFTFNE